LGGGLDMAANILIEIRLPAPYRALTRTSTVQPRKPAALQKCRVAAEDQLHEILENGFLDRGARELQRDALEAIDVDEGHGHDPRPIVDTKRDPRRDHGWDRKDDLAQRPVGIFYAAAGVLQPERIEGFLGKRDPPGDHLYRQRLGCGNLVVDVDRFEHRETDDAALVLTDRTVGEPRRIEDVAIAEIEPVFDRGLQAAEIGDSVFQPAKRLAQPCIDRLETLDVALVVG